MKAYRLVLTWVAVLALMLGAACSKSNSEAEIFKADSLAQDLETVFSEIDSSMAQQIKMANYRFASEAEIRTLLSSVQNVHEAVKTSCFVDNKGILRFLEPAEFKSSEGADVSQQDHNKAMLENHQPTLSSAFMAVEGLAVVTLARPLFDAEQQFIGSLVLTIDPSVLAQKVLTLNNIPAKYELWAMEPDGMIVLDQDPEEIGKNVFSDPLYEPYSALRELATTIAGAMSGEGKYLFEAAGTDKEVEKQASWASFVYHGRVWRVILVKVAK